MLGHGEQGEQICEISSTGPLIQLGHKKSSSQNLFYYTVKVIMISSEGVDN